MTDLQIGRNPSRSSPSAEERRKHVRHQSNRVISGLFNLQGSSDQWPVEVWDISQGGFSFLTSQPVAAGQVVEVELETPAGNTEMRFAARVAHVTHLPQGEFILGCAFLQEFSEEQVKSLL